MPFVLGQVVDPSTEDVSACSGFREAGATLCLWEPFSDGELRFVLNQALHGLAAVPAANASASRSSQRCTATGSALRSTGSKQR